MNQGTVSRCRAGKLIAADPGLHDLELCWRLVRFGEPVARRPISALHSDFVPGTCQSYMENYGQGVARRGRGDCFYGKEAGLRFVLRSFWEVLTMGELLPDTRPHDCQDHTTTWCVVWRQRTEARERLARFIQRICVNRLGELDRRRRNRTEGVEYGPQVWSRSIRRHLRGRK